MPKAKPVSLHPLTFDQAIDVLIKATPKPKNKRATSFKTKKRKGALKYQVQHVWEKMLHEKNLHAVEY
jgi:hypothetical protein